MQTNHHSREKPLLAFKQVLVKLVHLHKIKSLGALNKSISKSFRTNDVQLRSTGKLKDKLQRVNKLAGMIMHIMLLYTLMMKSWTSLVMKVKMLKNVLTMSMIFIKSEISLKEFQCSLNDLTKLLQGQLTVEDPLHQNLQEV